MDLKKLFKTFDRIIRNAFGDDQFPNSYSSIENRKFKEKLDEIERRLEELKTRR